MTRPGPNDLHFSALVGTPEPIGKRFICQVPENCKLTTLHIAATHLIHGLKLEYVNEDNETNHCSIGAAKDTWQSFAGLSGLSGLSGLGGLSSLSGLSGSSGWYLDTLRFHYRDGSQSDTFGGKGGDTHFQLSLHQKNGLWQGTIVGLWGHADSTGIEALGFMFWSVEKDKPVEKDEGVEHKR
ncbi:MAG: hypothetical protein ACRCYY_09355 [Trueperaceae bacterium]